MKTRQSRWTLGPVLLTAILMIQVVTATSQNVDLAFYKQAGEQCTRTLKRMLLQKGDLTPEEESAIRATGLNFRDGWAVKGFAINDGEQKRVVIYSGAIAMMDFIAQAFVLEGQYDDEGFGNRYVAYAGKILQKNTRYDNRGSSKREPLATPSQAVKDGIVPSDLIKPYARFSPESQSLKNGMIEASIAFIVLHEYGHIVKNHGARGPDVSLEAKRQQEVEADAWAVVHALKCDMNVAIALPMFSLFGSVDNETEHLMDHPSGQRRVLSSLKIIKRELQAGVPLAQKYKSDGQYDEIMAQLDGTIKKIQNEVVPSE